MWDLFHPEQMYFQSEIILQQQKIYLTNLSQIFTRSEERALLIVQSTFKCFSLILFSDWFFKSLGKKNIEVQTLDV